MPLSKPRRARVLAPALALSLLAAPAAWAADRVEVLAVTASSSDGMLMDAVDDDFETFWQNKGRGEKEAWLAVRFEAPAMIRGVRCKTGALHRDVRVDVETSADGLNYQPQLKDQAIATAKPMELLFPAPVQALYVRLVYRYVGGGAAPRFKLYELEALSAR